MFAAGERGRDVVETLTTVSDKQKEGCSEGCSYEKCQEKERANQSSVLYARIHTLSIQKRLKNGFSVMYATVGCISCALVLMKNKRSFSVTSVLKLSLHSALLINVCVCMY